MCSNWAKVNDGTNHTMTITLSIPYPIALRTIPEYPGRKLGIHFDSGDCITVYSQYRKFYYLHGDGNKYEIRFYQLVDGLGWIHDFDLKTPKRRTIEQIELNQDFDGSDVLLLTNVTNNSIPLRRFPEYPGINLNISLEPDECVYVSSEFRKVYFIHTDQKRYCMRFYRLMDGSGWICDFNHINPLQRSLSQEFMELPLLHLRSIAKNNGLEEICHNKTNHVISFKSTRERYNVYYKTCTVSILWFHPRLGRTYQFFHKQSLDDIRHIFSGSEQYDINMNTHNQRDEEGTEEQALRYQIALLTEEMNRMEREKNNLLGHLHFFEKRFKGKIQDQNNDQHHLHYHHSLNSESNLFLSSRPDYEFIEGSDLQQLISDNSNNKQITPPSTPTTSRSSTPIRAKKIISSPIKIPRKVMSDSSSQQTLSDSKENNLLAIKGDKVRCNMPDNHTDFITHNWSSQVNSIAIGGDCIIFIYDDCTWASTNGLPPLLVKRLHTRPTHLSPPAYVAAGSMNRSYILFTDGTSEWHASEGFENCMRSKRSKVQRVAFGRHWNSYLILFEDGTISYNNIPTELENTLPHKLLQEVNLGPNGEWFISTQDGSIFWMATSCQKIVEDLETKITDMIFGPNGTFIIRYR